MVCDNGSPTACRISSHSYRSRKPSLVARPEPVARATGSGIPVWLNPSSQEALDAFFVTGGATSLGSVNNGAVVPVGEKTLPAQSRRNPRRSAVGPRPAAPPTLVRQSDRKTNFVDSLVDSSTQIVEAIWPLSSIVCRSELGHKAVLPLRTFIQETLRRSRTSYSTLQVALYYLILIKPHVPQRHLASQPKDSKHSDHPLQCGRRMFLVALILASKYLQDRNYSARAWSKISGLNTQEINQNEVAFLLAVNWKLHISDEVFQKWTGIVLKYTPPSTLAAGGNSPIIAAQRNEWKQLILQLEPELKDVEGLVGCSSISSARPNDPAPIVHRCILNLPHVEHVCPSCVKRFDVISQTPTIMEQPPQVTFTPNHTAFPCGPLPTPRLTPQLGGFCAPAASTTAQAQCKWPGTSTAMRQVYGLADSQYLNRTPVLTTSSPQPGLPLGRSSLATSVSTSSSPESMVSDASQSSGSSVASASSTASATLNQRLGTSSRFPCPQAGESLRTKPVVFALPQRHEERYTSSLDSDCAPIGSLGETDVQVSRLPRKRELDLYRKDSDAAEILQAFHNYDTRYVEMGRPMSQFVSVSSCLPHHFDETFPDSPRPPKPHKRPCGSIEAVQEQFTIPYVH